jgi:hypothetical protein
MAKKIALDLDIKSASAGEAVTRTKTLKQELRELKNELQTMDEASPDFLKIAKAAGEIEDKIKATNEQVAAFASPANERALNGILDISTGIAGGFAAVQGAAALFGSENEDLQKAILKTQAAMSLLNGIIAIQNVLKKESAANTLLLSAAEKAAAVTTRLLALATTGLQKALIATGFGAIIVLIGTLIANFDKLKAAMQTATSQARKYAESQQEIAKNSLEKIENFEEEARTLRRLGFEEDAIAKRRRDNFIQALKDQESALKAQEELIKTTESSFKKVETWEKFGFGLIPRLLFGDEKDVENAKKGAEEIRKQIEKLENDRFEFEEKIKKEDAEREKKAEEEKKKIRTDAAKRRMEAQKVDSQRLISTIINDYDRELAALKFKHAEEQRLAKLNGENLAILKKAQDKELFDLELKNAEEVKNFNSLNIQDRTKQLDDFFARKKAIKEAEAALEQELLSQTSNVIGALSMIAKDNSVTQKALALAQIAFDTGVAISALVKNSQANPANSVTGGVAGAVQFATGLARILTSVAQAKRVVQSGSTSGAGAGTSAGAGMQAFGNIPTDVGSGLDTRAFTQGQTRVYVVENDITRAQRRVAQIRENAIID